MCKFFHVFFGKNRHGLSNIGIKVRVAYTENHGMLCRDLTRIDVDGTEP